MNPIPRVPWLITDSMVSFSPSFSLSSQSAPISRGNCFLRAVFWKSNLSLSCLAAISRAHPSLLKNSWILSSSFLIPMHSIASLTMLMVVNERLPRPIDVLGPNLFSNTRVRQPMVATSYWYLLGSSAFQSSCWLYGASRFTKLGKNLLAETLQANL